MAELEFDFIPPYVGSAYSPQVDITETADDITVTITDSRGEHSYTVDKTNDAIADAEAAETNANNAASTAEAKGQQAVDIATTAAASAQATANAAAQNANEKATLADNAASTANTAAGNADDAASDARDAIADAQAATQAANIATSNANAATSTATTAAQNADAKAALANTAASNADAKAVLANTAAANADTKATLADNAATSATTAAGKASTAASSANTAATNANTAAQTATTAAALITDKPDAVLEATVESDTPQTVTDAWPTTPRSAELYGKSVQDGTPTPSAPVDVQVVGSWNIFNPQYLASANWTEQGGIYSGSVGDLFSKFRSSQGGYPNTAVNGQVTFSFEFKYNDLNEPNASNGMIVEFHYTDGTSNNNYTRQPNEFTKYSFTSTAGKSVAYIAYGYTRVGPASMRNIQLEASSTATTYIPYGCIGLQIGETIVPINLQGNTLASLPDGTRDVLRVDSAGQVTIEKRTNSVKVSELNWSASSPESCIFRAQFESTNTPIPYTHSNNADYALSTGFIQKGYDPLTASDNGYFAIGLAAANNHRLICVDHRYSTQSDFEQGAASILCVYRLLDPTTIDLGTITLPEMSQPCDIAIYASLDPTWAIEYERDPNVVIGRIESSIAPVEGATASANYSVGSYLVHDSQLYRVTTAIATGETITPGSNVTATTVMAELIRLTA